MSPKKTVNVMVRMTPEEAEQLDRVGGIEPAVRGRSAAVRRLIRASMVPGIITLWRPWATGLVAALGARCARAPSPSRAAGAGGVQTGA